MSLRIRVIRLRLRLRQFVRIYVLGVSAMIVVAGVVLAELTTGELRWGLFGLFAGTGLGLFLTELISALSRRAEEERDRKLLEPTRARVRAAFRLGEFSKKAIDAFASGEVGNRYLEQFLLNSEALGFRGSLLDSMPALRGLPTSDARRRGLEIIERAAVSAGNDAVAFRELQFDLEYLYEELSDENADDAILNDRELREPIRIRVRRNFEWAERYTDDVAVVRAWDNMFLLWDLGALSSPREARMFVVGFQGFLALVGAEHLGFERWRHVVRGISEVGIRFHSPEAIHEDWVQPIIEDIELGWRTEVGQ